MFNHKGLIVLSGELTDELEMGLIEAGAEDIQSDNGLIEVVTTVSDLKNVLDNVSVKVEHAGLAYFAKDPVKIEGADSESLDHLVDALDELDDVDTVFTNVM